MLLYFFLYLFIDTYLLNHPHLHTSLRICRSTTEHPFTHFMLKAFIMASKRGGKSRRRSLRLPSLLGPWLVMLPWHLRVGRAFHQSYTNRVNRIIPYETFLVRVFNNPLNHFNHAIPVRSLVLSSQAHMQPKINYTTANERMKIHFEIISTKYKRVKGKQRENF